ncbi:hypothetical protein GE09DRAFT_1192143 [Coniochaeta sp. 2T2.1]|nr:hypothetical protein GE09DRAFT_1192143 [Coniochaeta sp. 2T2.1]
MPMLERTAATLEPCSLHKVLPSVPRSVRSRRQLHTAFWNHGAASAELFDACQAILGTDMEESPTNTTPVTPAPTEKGGELMTASAFLLDFLYPRGTLSLLRKLNCSPLDRYEKPSYRLGGPLARFQVAAVSSTPFSGLSAQEKAALDLAPREDENNEGQKDGVVEEGRTRSNQDRNAAPDVPKSFEEIITEKLGVESLDDVPAKGKRKEKIKADDPAEDPAVKVFEDAFAAKFTERPPPTAALDKTWALDDQVETAKPVKNRPRTFEEIFNGKVLKEEDLSDPEKLKKALSMGSSAFPDHVWHLYEHLQPDLREQYTVDVLRYLAVAPWIPEPRAFCDMVSRLDPFGWSQEHIKASIKAAQSMDDLPTATSFFSRALETRAWPQGFDLLLAYCLTNQRWEKLVELWDGCRERLLSDDVPKVDLYSTVRLRDLATRLQQFWENIRAISNETNYDWLKDSYNSLLRYILSNSMQELPADVATLMVKQLAEAVPYEEFIKVCVQRNHSRLASELYRLYRKLPDVKIRIPVLREMLEVYYPNNDFGMEMILKDWYSRYENLDYIAYRRFICFYAGHGDVASVARLWKEYKKLYKAKAVKDKRAIRALIDVHAVRGDVPKARAIFDEVTKGQGRRPDTMQYNMLLSAHEKARDLDGALKTFNELCEHTTPNNYSYGYLMTLAGSRGDLKLTLGLYRLARGAGIRPDVAMVDAMIQAYCESDRIHSAEELCLIATKGHVLPDEITYSGRRTTPYTIMWNTVLRQYAMRHDLTNVNRVLERMTELNVPYDGKTYEYLLLALVLCKQANHALKLVELSEEKGIFIPSAEHYLLLMSSYLATREPSAVMKISKLMTAKEYPESAEKMTKLMEAFGQWAQLHGGARLGTPANRYLEAALTAFRKSLGREERTGSVDDIRSVAEQYSKMIDILTQMRDFATIPEIMALYESQFPEHSSPKDMPLRLLNSLMRADFYEKKYDSVMESWNVAFDKVLSLRDHASLSPLPASEQNIGEISPAHRYLLNEALSTILKVHSATGDADSLLSIVSRVRDAGFALSGQNWNHYIQLLARFGRWSDAFLLCEEVLMPQWHGWAQRRRKLRQTVRLPIDLRRLGQSYRYAKPNTHTLLLLIRQFMELERMAPWSSEPASMVDKINADCPRFVRAAKTMIMTGSDLEMEILGTDVANGGDDELMRYIMKHEDVDSDVDEGRSANQSE